MGKPSVDDMMKDKDVQLTIGAIVKLVNDRVPTQDAEGMAKELALYLYQSAYAHGYYAAKHNN